MLFEEEAQEALQLAGGIEAVDRRARELVAAGNSPMAARLADWAYYGAPGDARALRLTVDVYLVRLMAPGMPLQESQVYMSHAAEARARLQQLNSPDQASRPPR